MKQYSLRLESPTSQSFRAASVAGRFDYTPTGTIAFEMNAELPTDRDDWQVGLICGPSGSGKSVLAREAFAEQGLVSTFDWPGLAIVDDFPESMNVEEITRTLVSVGLSAIPTWFTPFAALSNGQQFRANLARAIAERDYIVYDEFTSVVDRDVARTASYAVSKAIRKRPGKKFVGISCHSDIIPWLEPDWVFDTATSELRWGRLRRPRIQLRIFRGDATAWPLFKRHHYLTGNFHRGARVFLCYARFEDRDVERLVAFDSWIQMAGHTNTMQGHRGVVLPDYQGLGIGVVFFEECCELLTREKPGVRIFSINASPALNRQRRTSPVWRLTRKAGTQKKDGGDLIKNNMPRATNRLTTSWLYIPRSQRLTSSKSDSSSPSVASAGTS